MNNDTKTIPEWHGATAEEYRTAEALAMKVRDHRERPDVSDMTAGELLVSLLNPFTDEPLAEGALRAIAIELTALYLGHPFASDAPRGLVDAIGMIARRAEVAAETSRRLRKEGVRRGA